ncbi:MAG: hypothetical protein AB8I08_06480 [Sandaracinaceae bacterium]
MRVEARTVHTDAGETQAWVLTPLSHRVVGPARLRAFEEGNVGNALDWTILEAVRGLGGRAELLVMRARDDAGHGSWCFSDALTENERRALGYHLVLDQMPVFRRLIACGVCAFVHVEFGADEVDAYQHGVQRVLAELEARSVGEVACDEGTLAVLRVDRWVLRNLNFFFTLGLDEVLDLILTRKVELLRARIPHLRSLAAALPADAID